MGAEMDLSFFRLVSVVGAFAVFPVLAQNQAAVAQQQEQIRQGYQHQQDMYNGQEQMPSPESRPHPVGEWIKTWGAIANSNSGGIGVSKGKFSLQEAEYSALSECENAWGGCKVVSSYFNQCVALSSPEVKGGLVSIAKAGSVQSAIVLAGEHCKNDNAVGSCTLVYSDCSEPYFKRY